jgi:excisionase family DNA binding protein
VRILDHSRMMSTAQAGERLGVSRRRVWGLIRRGELPARKFAGIWIVERPVVEKLAEARKTI